VVDLKRKNDHAAKDGKPARITVDQGLAAFTDGFPTKLSTESVGKSEKAFQSWT
jgi:hypothetical protein